MFSVIFVSTMIIAVDIGIDILSEIPWCNVPLMNTRLILEPTSISVDQPSGCDNFLNEYFQQARGAFFFPEKMFK